MITRLQIVHCARQWLHTPYVHQGRQKGKAADCLFPLCVAEELGVLDKYGVPLKASDYPEYSSQPKDGLIHEEAVKRLLRKDARELAPGDLVTTRFGGMAPSHCGIVAEFRGATYRTLTIIHSDGSRVVEHSLTGAWRRRIMGAFSFPGVH